MGYQEPIWFHQCQLKRIPGNIPGTYVSLESELIKYHVNPETDKIKIKISGDRSKVSRISNFVVLSFSVITDDLTLSSKDQKVFCIVNCKEDYDHLKLACKPIFQKIDTLYEKASTCIEVEGKHFDGWYYEIFATCTCAGWISVIIPVHGIGSITTTRAALVECYCHRGK